MCVCSKHWFNVLQQRMVSHSETVGKYLRMKPDFCIMFNLPHALCHWHLWCYWLTDDGMMQYIGILDDIAIYLFRIMEQHGADEEHRNIHAHCSCVQVGTHKLCAIYFWYTLTWGDAPHVGFFFYSFWLIYIWNIGYIAAYWNWNDSIQSKENSSCWSSVMHHGHMHIE